MRVKSEIIVSAVALLTAVLCAADHSSAAAIHVDNRRGSDAADGSSVIFTDALAGPVRTIRRAFQLAQPGDQIVLAKSDSPYYESMELVGARHSGFELLPFTVVGNGAILSGARPVPPSAWRPVEQASALARSRSAATSATDRTSGNAYATGGLWKLTPWRKGHYQLLLGDQPAPEHPVPSGAHLLPEIPEGHWAAWRGSIYYQAAALEDPRDRPFLFAGLEVGLTLHQVRHVRIVDVTFRHFRLDGVNAHDQCSGVVLENVASLQNGRSGVAVGGTSSVHIQGSRLVENRVHQLLMTERGVAEVDEQTEMSAPPTIAH